MSVVSWIIVGFLAGGLARVATGAEKRGCLATIVIGILGGLIGGGLFNWAGERGINHFGLWSILVAFVGASALLFVFGGARRLRRR